MNEKLAWRALGNLLRGYKGGRRAFGGTGERVGGGCLLSRVCASQLPPYTQLLHRLEYGARHGVVVQLCEGHGLHIAEVGQGRAVDGIARQVEDAVGEDVAKLEGGRLNRHPFVLAEHLVNVGQHHGLGGRLLVFHEQWLVEPLPNIACGPALQEHPLAVVDEQVEEVALADGCVLRLDGEVVDEPLAVGLATLAQGALRAVGRGRRALQGTKIHDGRVVVGGSGAREEAVGQLGKLLLAHRPVNGCGDAEVAGQDAIDVAVHHGVGQPVGKGADGGGSVGAHALESPHIGIVRREISAAFHYLLGGSVEIAGAAVIPQSLPQAEYLVLAGPCQGGHGREPLYETFVVLLPLADARLLENDFGNPDAIGVSRLTPGQVVAAVLGIPG